MLQIEEVILLLSMKTKPSLPPERKPTGKVDLQRFKTTNGPVYNRPFHKIKPFLNWIKAMKIFLIKGIFRNTNKIGIIGSLIWETNTLVLYASKMDKFGLMILWLSFKELLFTFSLPLLWKNALKLKI